MASFQTYISKPIFPTEKQKVEKIKRIKQKAWKEIHKAKRYLNTASKSGGFEK